MTKLTYGLTPRCLATNQSGIRKGEQCKRPASCGQHSCWQHRCKDEACNNEPLHIRHNIPIVDKRKRQRYYFTRSQKGVETAGNKAQEPKAVVKEHRAKNNARVAQVVEIDSNAEIQPPRLRQNSRHDLTIKAAAIDGQHSRICSHEPRGGTEITRSERKEGTSMTKHRQDGRTVRGQDDNDDDNDDDKSMSPSCPCRCCDTRSVPGSFTESVAEEGDHSPGAGSRSNGKGKEPIRDSFAVEPVLPQSLAASVEKVSHPDLSSFLPPSVGTSDAYGNGNRHFQNEFPIPATYPGSPSIASSSLIGRSFSEEVADTFSAHPPASLQGSSMQASLAEALARNAEATARAHERGLQPGPSNTQQDFPVSTEVAYTASRSVDVGARAAETGRRQDCSNRQQIPDLEYAAALARNAEATLQAAARGIQLASPSIETQEDVAVAAASASQQHVRAEAARRRVRFQEPLTLQSATRVANAPINQEQHVRRRPTQPENRRQCSFCASGETRWLQECNKSCEQSVRKLLEILGNRNGRGAEGDTELLAELKTMLARLENCR